MAPSKNLTARNRLAVDFVPAAEPEIVAASPVPAAAGPASSTAAAPAAGSDTQAENQTAESEKKKDPNMVALADLVEAKVVVTDPKTQENKDKQSSSSAAKTKKASTAGNPGDPDASYEVRDVRLFGKVRLHQDPAPGKTKGQDASGEVLIMHNEGPGKAIFNLYHRDPRVKFGGPTPRRLPWAKVITEDQTIKGELIGLNQLTDEAWVFGPGQVIQLTDRNMMTDKTDDKPAQDSGKSGAAKDSKTVSTKPKTRAGKVQSDRVPLVITWQEKMLFHGRSLDPENNPSAKAEFFKEVWAFMEDGKLYARDKMTTYTDKPIPLADLGKMSQKKRQPQETGRTVRARVKKREGRRTEARSDADPPRRQGPGHQQEGRSGQARDSQPAGGPGRHNHL